MADVSEPCVSSIFIRLDVDCEVWGKARKFYTRVRVLDWSWPDQWGRYKGRVSSCGQVIVYSMFVPFLFESGLILSTAWKPLLHILKEKQDKHTIHNNLTATWHASFIPPPPHPPTYPEPPTTWCRTSPIGPASSSPKPWHGYKISLLSLTPHSLHPAFEYGTDTGFRNVGQLQFDAGKIPKRTYTIFKSRQKFEI